MKNVCMREPLSLNHVTNVDTYNCGGFALGTLNWYCPRGWNCDVNHAFNNSINSILEDFPELSQVNHYSNISDKYDVIGFRLDIQEEETDEYEETNLFTGKPIIVPSKKQEVVDDFHFLLRTNGKWYHKPGSVKIEEVKFDPEDEWPHGWKTYNSKIVWFVRDHKEDFFYDDEYDEDNDNNECDNNNNNNENGEN